MITNVLPPFLMVHSVYSQVVLALERLSTQTTSILAFRAVRQLVLCQCTGIIEQFIAHWTFNARMQSDCDGTKFRRSTLFLRLMWLHVFRCTGWTRIIRQSSNRWTWAFIQARTYTWNWSRCMIYFIWQAYWNTGHHAWVTDLHSTNLLMNKPTLQHSNAACISKV